MFQLDPADPDQARALARLSTDTVIWLTTVSPASAPQPSAVWFWWDGETVLVFSGGTARIKNIAANPRVALHFNTDEYGDDIAILYGLAEVDPSDTPGQGCCRVSSPLRREGASSREGLGQLQLSLPLPDSDPPDRIPPLVTNQSTFFSGNH